MSRWFSRLASSAATIAGHYAAFTLATVLIVVWALSGPVFGYSTNWQLCVNTGTTIVTFLMVFLIQNQQNTDTTAIQRKLDELIRVNRDARNDLIGIEREDAT